jgi:hypothetical protein
MNIARDALAERAVWIVNVRLGNRAEDRMAAQAKAGDDTEDERRYNPSLNSPATPSPTKPVKARSVVDTSERANPIRSGS